MLFLKLPDKFTNRPIEPPLKVRLGVVGRKFRPVQNLQVVPGAIATDEALLLNVPRVGNPVPTAPWSTRLSPVIGKVK